MDHFQRLFLTLTIIFISLSVGYFFQQIYFRHSGNKQKFDNIRKVLQRLAIFFLMPVSAMLSLWGLPKPEPGLLVLPFVGTASYIIGGFLALWLGRLIKLSRIQLGSYYGCGAFTNLGAVGGLVCLIFLGENSIALVALYRLLEEIYFFGVAFPVAQSYNGPPASKSFSWKKFKPHPGIAIIVAALAIGIILNMGGIHRPLFLSPVASIFMVCSTICLLISIGMNLHLSATLNYIKPALLMCVVKFVFLPFVITGLAFLLGAATLENGLVLKTILILSSMPVAMYALVPPALFNLDIDLANTCWVVTTLGLFIVIPWLMFLLPHI